MSGVVTKYSRNPMIQARTIGGHLGPEAASRVSRISP